MEVLEPFHAGSLFIEPQHACKDMLQRPCSIIARCSPAPSALAPGRTRTHNTRPTQHYNTSLGCSAAPSSDTPALQRPDCFAGLPKRHRHTPLRLVIFLRLFALDQPLCSSFWSSLTLLSPSAFLANRIFCRSGVSGHHSHLSLIHISEPTRPY